MLLSSVNISDLLLVSVFATPTPPPALPLALFLYLPHVCHPLYFYVPNQAQAYLQFSLEFSSAIAGA